MGTCLTNNMGLITLIGIFVTVFAIFYSPIVALRVQKKIEAFNEKKQKKENIFKILMATRADVLSLEHVKALNMIDIEFYEEKTIRNAWNVYRDHLNSYPKTQNEQEQKNWGDKARDYLATLLSSISEYQGYNFDKVILKKGAYLPETHYWQPRQEEFIRAFLIKVLNGETAIKIELIPPKQ